MEKNFDKSDLKKIENIQLSVDAIKEKMRRRAELDAANFHEKYGIDYELKNDPIYIALDCITAECEIVIENNY